MEYGEAIALAEQGRSAQELMAMGVPRATAYRAQRIARYGQIRSNVSAISPAPEPASGEAQPETTATPPVAAAVIRKPNLPSGISPKSDIMAEAMRRGGTLVVDLPEGLDAEQLAITTRAQRFPTPSLLGAAYTAARHELHWKPMGMRDFIDTVLFYFFWDRGYVIGGQYYSLEEAETILQVAGKEVRDASPGHTNPATQSPAPGSAGGGQVHTEPGPDGKDRQGSPPV